MPPIYTETNGKSSSTLSSSSQKNTDTIAICLVIVDELHHEEIWKWWLGEHLETKEDNNPSDKCINLPEKELPASSSSSCSSLPPSQPLNPSSEVPNEAENKRKFKARLFIHAKYPERIKSPWVRARTLGTLLRVIYLFLISSFYYTYLAL